MRLKRGTLAGEKVDGHWIVSLDPTEQPTKQNPTTDQTATKQPTGEQQNTTVHRQDADTTPDSHTAALIEALQAQVLDLQRRLDRQDVNMHMLIAKLPNPDGGLPAMIETGDYRQGVPTASPDATSDAAAAPSTPDTLRQSWRFWKRRKP